MTRGCPEAQGWRGDMKEINGWTYWLIRITWNSKPQWQANGPGWDSERYPTRRQACIAAHEHAENHTK